MIYGKTGTEYKYDFNEKKFRISFEFLAGKDLAALPVGSIKLGEGVIANIQRYNTSPAAELSFETHEKYFDIQYVIKGSELMGVCGRSGLCAKTEYDSVNDITLYCDPENYGYVILQEGDYIVLAPEDAHKPRCAVTASEDVQKIVIKVPV